MHYLSVLLRRVFIVVALLGCAKSFAEVVELDAQMFIEAASLRSISEVETAKVALQKSASPAVQRYAHAMIAENTARINELRVIAEQHHLSMLSDTELQAKARKYVFARKGQAFDSAYAGMRAVERRKMVNLYRHAINSDNAPMKHYAEMALPALMHQLYMAQELTQLVAASPSSDLLASK